MHAAAVILAPSAEIYKSASDVLYSYVFFGEKKCYENYIRTDKILQFSDFFMKLTQNDGEETVRKKFSLSFTCHRGPFLI